MLRKPLSDIPTLTVQDFIATSAEIKELRTLLAQIKIKELVEETQKFIQKVDQAQSYDDLLAAIPSSLQAEIHSEANQSAMLKLKTVLPYMPGISQEIKDAIPIMTKIMSLGIELYKKVVPFTSQAEREHILAYLSGSTTYKTLIQFCEDEAGKCNSQNPNLNTINKNAVLTFKLQKARTFTELLDALDEFNFSYHKPAAKSFFSLFPEPNPQELVDQLSKKVEDRMIADGYSYHGTYGVKFQY